MHEQKTGKQTFRFRNVQTEDVSEILRIYNATFPGTRKTKAWWDWWYCQNPAGESFQVLAETSNSEIVGMLGMTPFRLWNAGKVRIVAQDSLGIIRHEYQRQGVFSAVARELHRQEAKLYPFNFCFCNEKSWLPYVKNVGSVLRSVGYFYEKSVKSTVDHTRFILRPVHKFKEEHDQFWNAIKSRLHAAQVRDTRYLNWRFADSRMGNNYLIYDVLEGGKLFGYLVLQAFGDKLDLLDYCLLEGTGLGDLDLALDILECTASQEGYTRVAFWALDLHTGVETVLRRRGYTRGDRRFFMLSRDFTKEPRNSNLSQIKNWSYTAGDMELF